MLKIRLRRTGAKFQPSYRVVVADSRAPRDGAFVAGMAPEILTRFKARLIGAGGKRGVAEPAAPAPEAAPAEAAPEAPATPPPPTEG